MYQPHLVVMVDRVSFCVKAGYFWPKCGLIWVERDLSRPNLHSAPNGMRERFRRIVGWRKKDRLFRLLDESQHVFPMISPLRGIRLAVAG